MAAPKSETDFVTDTHGLIWYLEDSPRLGNQAKAAFDACDQGTCLIHIPSICLVEIIYLQEKGRIDPTLLKLFQEELAANSSGLRVADLSLDSALALSQIPRQQIPDMPDRIVAATAVQLGLPLISCDRKIQLSSVQTIW